MLAFFDIILTGQVVLTIKALNKEIPINWIGRIVQLIFFVSCGAFMAQPYQSMAQTMNQYLIQFEFNAPDTIAELCIQVTLFSFFLTIHIVKVLSNSIYIDITHSLPK